MPNLTVGRIIRLHAAVLGVLLAASLPAFAAVSSHLAAIDGLFDIADHAPRDGTSATAGVVAG